MSDLYWVPKRLLHVIVSISIIHARIKNMFYSSEFYTKLDSKELPVFPLASTVFAINTSKLTIEIDSL